MDPQTKGPWRKIVRAEAKGEPNPPHRLRRAARKGWEAMVAAEAAEEALTPEQQFLLHADGEHI